MPNQLTFPFCPRKESKLEAIRKGHIPPEFRGQETVYLLHFPPMGGEKHKISHYLGSCRDLKRRLRQHRKGKNGAAITNELKRRKLKFACVQVWKHVNRDFEKYLKSWRSHKEFCPDCNDVPFFYGGENL